MPWAKCRKSTERTVDFYLTECRSFPAGDAAVMLAAARCKYVAEGGWGSRRYLDTELLDGWDEREVLKRQS